MYEATSKNGRGLHERAQTSHDRQHLENLLAELKDTWDTISGKATERWDTVGGATLYQTNKQKCLVYSIFWFASLRQHKLEEALLFSGRFTDALQALNDWLYRAEPQLAEDVPVGGDKDMVHNLIDKHKVQHLSHLFKCIRNTRFILVCIHFLWICKKRFLPLACNCCIK